MSDAAADQSAEIDHPEPPERIGYRDPWPRTEYGVFEDRRSKGLGFSLVETTEDAEHASRLLLHSSQWPRFLRVRTVTYAPWEHLNLISSTGQEVRRG